MTTEPTYEAVLWDIGGVIVNLPSVREGYAAFVDELAADHGLDPADALETWRSALGDHFKGREGTEYRTASEGYRKATRALFDDPPAESAWRPLFERTTAAALRPEDGAVETVRALADAGYRLGIVSDIDAREADNMLDAFGLGDAFDHVTTSEAVGYTKPDPRMFEDGLSGVGVDAADALMVGDRYRHDVAGAADAGIDAVAYGADAAGPAATYEVDDLRELLDVLGVEHQD